MLYPDPNNTINNNVNYIDVLVSYCQLGVPRHLRVKHPDVCVTYMGFFYFYKPVCNTIIGRD